MRETHEGVSKELKSLQAIHKSLKTENNELKLKHTAMQGELLECQNETSSLDVEVSKLTSCCEVRKFLIVLHYFLNFLFILKWMRNFFNFCPNYNSFER